MEVKEAIKRIKDHKQIHFANEPRAIRITEALDMAIESLEKQIPKKPTGDLHSVPHYRCPTCKCAVVVYENDKKLHCCHWCGQAIDWE